jgi:hypothetical protein
MHKVEGLMEENAPDNLRDGGRLWLAESYGHVGGWAGQLFLVVALMVAAIDLLSGRGPW